MNSARMIILAVALSAGGVAAYLASGFDNKPPDTPVVQLPTVDVLVAKDEIGVGQRITAENLLWQTWTESTASRHVRTPLRPSILAGNTRTFRSAYRKQNLKIVGHRAEIESQLCEEVALVEVDGESADQVTILSLVSQIFNAVL